jgi:hypothetical protein
MDRYTGSNRRNHGNQFYEIWKCAWSEPEQHLKEEIMIDHTIGEKHVKKPKIWKNDTHSVRMT